MPPQSRVIVAAFVSATVFAVIFALVGASVVIVLGLLAPDPSAKQEFATNLVIGIFSLYAAWITGLTGAAIGALYGLVPRSARDVPMAIAIGVGVAVAASLLLPRGAYPITLLSAPLALTAVLSAASAWITRRLGIV